MTTTLDVVASAPSQQAAHARRELVAGMNALTERLATGTFTADDIALLRNAVRCIEDLETDLQTVRGNLAFFRDQYTLCQDNHAHHREAA